MITTVEEIHRLHRLLRHRKKFVAAQGVTKKIPAEPVALGLTGDRVYSNPPASGLERIMQVGLAFALIDTRALMRLGPPLFTMQWVEDKMAYAGEDVSFCWKLRSQGIDLYLDHGLSYEIGHVGQLEYRHEYVGKIVEAEEIHDGSDQIVVVK